ncbi:MAG: DUF1638 domain-containing protein, partial [Alphaproteobacteria bacterium]|nr:DUF1638 domain-containing protein [Alphaproteobacteria bacterium]
GALAREMMELIRVNRWGHMTVACLPAQLHNTPDRIPELVRAKIKSARGRYGHIVVLYGDCGTGGELDRVLAEEKVERIAGPHCYQFYAGAETFAALHDAEPGTFYLTDYLVRHFDRLIIAGLGLDRYPQLLSDYFGNYTRLVYLAQTKDEKLAAMAVQAAKRLGLAYLYRYVGFGEMADFMTTAAGNGTYGRPDHRLLA